MLNIDEIRIKTKCDFIGCKNFANVSFFDLNDKRKKLNLCNDCVYSIYGAYARTIVPKGIESPFKTRKLTKK